MRRANKGGPPASALTHRETGDRGGQQTRAEREEQGDARGGHTRAAANMEGERNQQQKGRTRQGKMGETTRKDLLQAAKNMAEYPSNAHLPGLASLIFLSHARSRSSPSSSKPLTRQGSCFDSLNLLADSPRMEVGCWSPRSAMLSFG